MERRIENSSVDSLEEEMVGDYVIAMRSVLLEDGKPPFVLLGTRVFDVRKRLKIPSKNVWIIKRGDSSS